MARRRQSIRRESAFKRPRRPSERLAGASSSPESSGRAARAFQTKTSDSSLAISESDDCRLAKRQRSYRPAARLTGNLATGKVKRCRTLLAKPSLNEPAINRTGNSACRKNRSHVVNGPSRTSLPALSARPRQTRSGANGTFRDQAASRPSQVTMSERSSAISSSGSSVAQTGSVARALAIAPSMSSSSPTIVSKPRSAKACAISHW